MKLVFAVSAEQRLIFTDSAVARLLEHAQHSHVQSEAGGVLLGRHLLESRDIVVDDVTAPQASDRRSRFSFFRSKQHSLVANERWKETQGRTAYLGLWHTHPERDPTPSCVDRRDWSKAVSRDSFEGDTLFFPIVGTERIRVWCKTRTGQIQQLQEVGGRNG